MYQSAINHFKMTSKKVLAIAAISLFVITFSSCTKEEEDEGCIWFPAQTNATYTKKSKDVTTEYKTDATNTSVNFENISFQSTDCENITVTVPGGTMLPAWDQIPGNSQVIDAQIGEVIYSAFQSDSVHRKYINGFTYEYAKNGTIHWRNPSASTSGKIDFWFADNIGLIAVQNIFNPKDKPTEQTDYELKLK